MLLLLRISDLLKHHRGRQKESLAVRTTSEVTKFPDRESYHIERLGADMIEDYAEKARSILVGIAKRRTLITYDTLMHRLNCGPGREYCGDIVRKVSEIELAEGRPRLSAVVIRSDTRMVGGGFFGLPNTPESIRRSKWEEWHNPLLNLEEQEYWRDELQKVYDYWCPRFQ